MKTRKELIEWAFETICAEQWEQQIFLTVDEGYISDQFLGIMGPRMTQAVIKYYDANAKSWFNEARDEEARLDDPMRYHGVSWSDFA